MTGGKAVQVVFAANNSAYRKRKRAHRACEQCKSRRVYSNPGIHLLKAVNLTENRESVLHHSKITSVVQAVLRMAFSAGHGYYPLESLLLTLV